MIFQEHQVTASAVGWCNGSESAIRGEFHFQLKFLLDLNLSLFQLQLTEAIFVLTQLETPCGHLGRTWCITGVHRSLLNGVTARPLNEG